MAKAGGPLSEEALVHLREYKYSSVDKSFLSNYVLRYYVKRLDPYIVQTLTVP